MSAVGVAFDAAGDPAAPPVLLCHALGTDRTLWDRQVAALAGDFHVVRYDAPGHGATAPPTPPTTVDDLAACAVAVLDELGLSSVSVVGAALGATAAIRLAAIHPQRVDRLVLANAAARAGTPQAWDERAALARSQGMAKVADFVLPRFFTDGFAAQHPDVVAGVRATVEATDPDGYAACCAALRDADLSDDLGHIGAPALVLSATHDLLTTPADGRALADAIADSRYEELDAAHLACVEQADAFSAAVRRFLVSR